MLYYHWTRKKTPCLQRQLQVGDLSVDQKFGQLYYSTNRAICQQGLVTFNKKEDKYALLRQQERSG